MSLKQWGPTIPGCMTKSITSRSREIIPLYLAQRAVHLEGHREMRSNGHKLQREKLQFGIREKKKKKHLPAHAGVEAEKRCNLPLAWR